MEHTFAQGIAQLLSIPEWAPKAVWRTAGVIIVLTAVAAPNVLREGITIWVKHETAQIMHKMQPVLDDLATPDSADGESR